MVLRVRLQFEKLVTKLGGFFMSYILTGAIFAAAAATEIGGSYAFWAWLKLEKSSFLIIPGLISLGVFAFLLTRIDSVFAGRTFAAYGGVYIFASLIWLRLVEGKIPDRWDLIGGIICIFGAGVIIFGPRAP